MLSMRSLSCDDVSLIMILRQSEIFRWDSDLSRTASLWYDRMSTGRRS